MRAARSAALRIALGTAFAAACALGTPGSLGAQITAADSASAARATVVGVVRDSLAGRPLARATVQLAPVANLAGGARSVEADSAGAFRIAGLAPGRYLITFLHPRLDSLGLEAATHAVDVAAGATEVRVDLAIPGARTIVAALCGERRDTSGALIGRVVDAVSDAPVAAGAVVVRWTELVVDAAGLHRGVRSVRAPVGADGRYAACGVPADVEVGVRATARDSATSAAARDTTAGDTAAAARARSSGEIEVKLEPAAPLLYRDLLVAPPPAAAAAAGPPSLGTSAPNASRAAPARLAGRVRRPDGTPARGARVVVRGTGAADSVAVADSAGTYHLDRLPGGTYGVEAIAIGFTPARAAADLYAGRAAALDLGLGKRVVALDRVQVYGAAPRATSEFARRVRQGGGFGRFLTAADIERRSPLTIGDALMTVPGLHVGGSDAFGRPQVLGRANCVPAFYLDGMRVEGGGRDIDNLVNPAELGGVEVYPDAAFAPALYSRGNCASILLWTKGALR